LFVGILITAGAGIGVDSGLPDFRGKDGFWTAYKAFEGKFQFQDCANPKFLEKHPKLFWGFYGHRIELYRKTVPHTGFEILKKFAKLPWIKEHFVTTSNVDGQFQKAGFDMNQIYEVHGSIHHLQCNTCQIVTSAESISVQYDSTTVEAKEPLPGCLTCKNILRPNLLLFNDYDWISERYDQQEEKISDFLRKCKIKKI